MHFCAFTAGFVFTWALEAHNSIPVGNYSDGNLYIKEDFISYIHNICSCSSVNSDPVGKYVECVDMPNFIIMYLAPDFSYIICLLSILCVVKCKLKGCRPWLMRLDVFILNYCIVRPDGLDLFREFSASTSAIS